MSSKLMLLAGSLLLAGCSTTAHRHIGEDDPGLGEAVKFNAAAQIINPAPVYPQGGALPGDSGVKAQSALERYRTDKVKPLETMSSTESSSGGSGGGSGSAPPR